MSHTEELTELYFHLSLDTGTPLLDSLPRAPVGEFADYLGMIRQFEDQPLYAKNSVQAKSKTDKFFTELNRDRMSKKAQRLTDSTNTNHGLKPTTQKRDSAQKPTAQKFTAPQEATALRHHDKHWPALPTSHRKRNHKDNFIMDPTNKHKESPRIYGAAQHKPTKATLPHPGAILGPVPDHDPDSDDSGLDATFDKLEESGPHAVSSPTTSPPNSSGTEFTDSHGTVVPGFETQSGDPLPAKHQHRKRHGPLHLHMDELTTDKIEVPLPAQPAPEPDTLTDQLRRQLARAQEERDGMANELEYLRQKLAVLEAPAQATAQAPAKPGASRKEEHTTQTLTRPQGHLAEAQSRTVPMDEPARTHPNDTANITLTCTCTAKPATPAKPQFKVQPELLPEAFRKQYYKLNLAKVDELDDTAKGNCIKHILLLTLISDVDSLPTVMPRLGSYLRFTLPFLDKLHAHCYPLQKALPLEYLRNEALPMRDLEACLVGMLEQLQKRQ